MGVVVNALPSAIRLSALRTHLHLRFIKRKLLHEVIAKYCTEWAHSHFRFIKHELLAK